MTFRSFEEFHSIPLNLRTFDQCMNYFRFRIEFETRWIRRYAPMSLVERCELQCKLEGITKK